MKPRPLLFDVPSAGCTPVAGIPVDCGATSAVRSNVAMHRRISQVSLIAWTVYCGVGAIGAIGARWLGVSLLDCPQPLASRVAPFAFSAFGNLQGVPIPLWVRVGSSVVGGLTFAAVTIVLTRWLSERTAWARALADQLRPFAKPLTNADTVMLGLASGISEEIFFRGFLAQWLGVTISSIVFGLLHQARGPSRWVWATWAAVMGWLFGALFFATGSLIGPIVAHVLINTINLRRLRDERGSERAGRLA